MQKSDRRSLRQLIVDLGGGLGDLIREEIALVRAEMSEKAAALREGTLALSLGGTLAFAGFLVLLQSLTLALDLALEALWLSSAIVGLFATGAGATLLGVGSRKIKNQSLTPRRTMEAIRQDKDLLREHIGAPSRDAD